MDVEPLPVLYQQALEHHQKGRLGEAEALYRRILARKGDHADSLHLLGVIAHQTNHSDAAVVLIGQAIRLAAGVPSYHNNLGLALQAQGLWEAAAAAFERAIFLQPHYVAAYNNRGIALKTLGRLEEAAECFERLLAFSPTDRNALGNLALVREAQKQFDLAVACLERALAIKSDDVPILCHLAQIHKFQGHLSPAIECYQRVLQVQPTYVEVYYNLGVCFAEQGRTEDAVACYQRALAIKPDYVEVMNNLGNLHQSQGRLEDAGKLYRQALALKPDYPNALYNLGAVLQAENKLDEAITCYQRAIAFKSDYVEAYLNLGTVYKHQNRLEEALACHSRAIALQSDYADGYFNLGNTLKALGRQEEAVAAFQRVLVLKPDYADGYLNLGTALHELGRFDQAQAHYERAAVLKPNWADAHYNLGGMYQELGKFELALAHYERALALKPDYVEAEFSRALISLRLGDFAVGWVRYDSRWRTEPLKSTLTKHPLWCEPLWHGETLPPGRRLLVRGEQGVGDEILFAGLIPDLTRRGLEVVLECDPRLRTLFARSFPQITVVERSVAGDAILTHELAIAARIPAGALPRYLRTTLADFRTTTSPYLTSDLAARERFRARTQTGKLAVGLAWYSKNEITGRLRSLTLAQLAPVLAVPGIRWVSLQYGAADGLAAEAAAAGVDLLIEREVDQFVNIDLFAAQVAALDMVVSIDNSTALLAGALGVPTWLLLPLVPDWRWMVGREDSPWYPTLRLFRQPEARDWQSVLERVHAALVALPKNISKTS